MPSKNRTWGMDNIHPPADKLEFHIFNFHATAVYLLPDGRVTVFEISVFNYLKPITGFSDMKFLNQVLKFPVHGDEWAHVYVRTHQLQTLHGRTLHFRISDLQRHVEHFRILSFCSLNKNTRRSVPPDFLMLVRILVFPPLCRVEPCAWKLLRVW